MKKFLSLFLVLTIAFFTTLTFNVFAAITTNTRNVFSGYTVNVTDYTTRAVAANSPTYPIKTIYFYSADHKVLGSISNADVLAISKKYQKEVNSYSGDWFANEFNIYRGLAGTKSTTTTTIITNNSQKLGTPEEFFNLINQKRAEQGIAPFTYDYSAQDMTDTRAIEITTLFSHIRPNGKDISDYGYGEVLHRTYYTAQDAFNAFLNSPPHREILLNPNYTRITVSAAVGSDGRAYWTALIQY